MNKALHVFLPSVPILRIKPAAGQLAGFDLPLFHLLPLFDLGLAWLLPTLLTCGLGMLLRPREDLAAEAA